jgi:hypothetical protein
MAAEVGTRTLARSGVKPDVILYATETFEGSTPAASGSFLASALGHPTAVVLTVAGHDCGNLGLLSQVAEGLLTTTPAVRAVAALRTVSGREPKDFKRALFNNYRLSSQRFMAGAAGFLAHQLLPGPVAEYGHAFAADLLVSCDLFSGDGTLTPGDGSRCRRPGRTPGR